MSSCPSCGQVERGWSDLQLAEIVAREVTRARRSEQLHLAAELRKRADFCRMNSDLYRADAYAQMAELYESSWKPPAPSV